MKLTQYDRVALKCSRVVTTEYSTSFSLGILMLGRRYRPAIYAIYGFVRLADEIVDTFFDKKQEEMLREFREDTHRAVTTGISSNPVLHSFQWVVRTYDIDIEYIEAFLESMAMDLSQKSHDDSSYKTYIYGSAEAVGLMCLKVFCGQDRARFTALLEPARKLGSAFQKVNFLRDIRSDYLERGRVYFPGVDFGHFTNEEKVRIEAEIEGEFDGALKGIRQLDRGSRRGVYLAYIYYRALFSKIRKTSPEAILGKRFRISDARKAWLLARSVVYDFLGII